LIRLHINAIRAIVEVEIIYSGKSARD